MFFIFIFMKLESLEKNGKSASVPLDKRVNAAESALVLSVGG